MSMIRATRQEISDRFSVLGFNVRTNGRRWFEIAVATDPALFERPQARTPQTFFSTRASGPLLAERGEAVYLLPPEVLRRFVGHSRLYYGMATFADANYSEPQVALTPGEESPWVSIQAFTGKVPRRMMALRPPGAARAGVSDEYGSGSAGELVWAGDAPRPGLAGAPATRPVGDPSFAGGAGPAGGQRPTEGAATSSGFVYDDGFGPLPRAASTPEPEPGIDEPIPDELEPALSLGHVRTLQQDPEYPRAAEFIPARFFRSPRSARSVERIVIHITDGSTGNPRGTARYFQNPTRWLRVDVEGGEPQLERDASGVCTRFRYRGSWKDCAGGRTRVKSGRTEAVGVVQVSAHYAVGQDGTVIQMVRHADVAFHAGSANNNSIGIEHNANPRDLPPSEAQYLASAELVRFLAAQYGVPLDREHILGHAEADPNTTHTSCPNAVWDWDLFMSLLASGASTGQALARGVRPLNAPSPVVSVGAPIVGAVLSRVINNQGDVRWELDQLKGIKHPGGDASQSGSAPYQTATTTVRGPQIENLLTDQISADFEIRWQYNGLALGNIEITNVGTNDAVGWGLDVKASISDDANLYDGRAALNVRFYYRFTRALGSDQIGVFDLKLHANGQVDQSFRWTQSSSLGLPQARPLAAPAVLPIVSAIAGAVMTRIINNEGDIHWELDQLKGLKHPGDDPAQAGSSSFQTTTTTIRGPQIENLATDQISADFEIRWQYNGRSLGNIDITNIGTNDAVGWGLDIKGTISDDANTYAGRAAVNVRFYYRFTRALGSDQIGVFDLKLHANGHVDQSFRWTQSSSLGLAHARRLSSYPQNAPSAELDLAPPPPARARALSGAEAAIAIGGVVLDRVLSNEGDVSWELDQFRGIKHPNDTPPSPQQPFRDAPTIRLDDWPKAGGIADAISAWFTIDWQYNGRSLGNVRITNVGVNDSIGWGLSARAQIMDDNVLYPPNECAALRVRIHYRFTRSIGSDVIAVTDVHLYGDGTHERQSRWEQASALAAE